MNHTPGPWKEVDGFIVGGPWADGEFHDICDPRCAPPDDDNTAMINANARLIAAAPELLAALQGLLAVFTAYIDTEDVANADIVEAVRDARATIAKAL
jgi:hypothetical protein